jgi:hypothetical protein
VKKFLLVVVLTVFILSACGSIATPVPAPTNTPLPPPTETPIPPTATLEPSPTPVPLGGGGKLIMKVNPLLVPKEFNAQEPASWFTASSDGTNLKLLDWQIWSLSPDGKRALTYTIDKKVSLTNLDGTGLIPLDASLNFFINVWRRGYEQPAIWLPNGNVVVVAREEQSAKASMYFISRDGKLTIWEKPSQIMGCGAELLFLSPNGEDIYWENIICGDGWSKHEYYVTKLDDSEQKQILKKAAKNAQSFYLSPSGQYIVYLNNRGLYPDGCYVYKIADGTTTKILPDIPDRGIQGLGFCVNHNHWSPTEDILVKEPIDMKDGISIWSAADGKISHVGIFSDINAGGCDSISWTPDGKYLFLSVCVEKYSGELSSLHYSNGDITLPFDKSLGQRLINISTGEVTEYPDAGFCKNAVISPDSKWVLLDLCTNEKNLLVYPSQLLNLDTKEMVPLFQSFVSDNPEVLPEPPPCRQSPCQDSIYKDWYIFWIP